MLLKVSLKTLKLLVQTLFIDFIFVLMAWLALYVNGYRIAAVISGSMEPAIPMGSLVVYAADADFQEVKLGDVVVFSRPDGMEVCHRAVQITERGIETKGDANSISDGISTTKDNFKGVLWIVMPWMGYLIIKVQEHSIVLLAGCAAIFVAALLSLIFITYFRETKESLAGDKGTDHMSTGDLQKEEKKRRSRK